MLIEPSATHDGRRHPDRRGGPRDLRRGRKERSAPGCGKDGCPPTGVNGEEPDRRVRTRDQRVDHRVVELADPASGMRVQARRWNSVLTPNIVTTLAANAIIAVRATAPCAESARATPAGRRRRTRADGRRRGAAASATRRRSSRAAAIRAAEPRGTARRRRREGKLGAVAVRRRLSAERRGSARTFGDSRLLASGRRCFASNLRRPSA